MLEILAQAAAIQPGYRAFHNPAPCEKYNALLSSRALEDSQCNPQQHGSPFNQITDIGLVSPSERQGWTQRMRLSQNPFRNISVLDIGGANPRNQQVACCVNREMALAPIDLFAATCEEHRRGCRA